MLGINSKRKSKKTNKGPVSTIVLHDHLNTAEAAADEAEAISIAPVDEANAVGQPKTIGPFHHELEYDEKAAEQKKSWLAAGIRMARGSAIRAAGLRHQAGDLERVTGGHLDLLAESRERVALFRKVFASHTRRERGDKMMYLLRMGALLGGDVVGVAGASIILGELPWLAVIQGLASGAAAITAGLIGADVKDIVRMRARKKHPDEMTDEERQVAHHFSGKHEGEKIVGALAATMLLVTLLIFGSVVALRSPTQGTTAALAFALLAAAVSLASFYNSFSYSDEMAAVISNAENTYKRDLKLAMKKLIPVGARREHAEAEVTATSIRDEHELQGDAAVHGTGALKHGINRRHPGVAGHGKATDNVGDRVMDPDMTASAGIDGVSENEGVGELRNDTSLQDDAHTGSADENTVSSIADSKSPIHDAVPYELEPEMADTKNGHSRNEP